jgi:ABC-2 type transport system permease protein
VLDIAGLGLLTLLAIFAGMLFTGGGVGLAGALAATVQLAALSMLFGTLALAVGAASGRTAVASGVAVGVALVTYLVDALANLVGWLGPFESPFHWYAPANPLVAGFSVSGLGLLIGCTALLVVIAVRAFDRRDIGV